MEGRQGAFTQTMTIEQNGDKIKGALKGPRAEAPLEGTVKGNKISFTVKRDTPRGEVTLEYTGTVDGDSMKGTLSTPAGSTIGPQDEQRKRRRRKISSSKFSGAVGSSPTAGTSFFPLLSLSWQPTQIPDNAQESQLISVAARARHLLLRARSDLPLLASGF